MRRRILRFLTLSTALLLWAAAPVVALDLVATAPSLGALARAVGGADVQVRVLAPSDRDLHRIQAKPSMMQALRGADLLISIGAELETAWLTPAIGGAGNPRILPGQPGHFEAADQVDLLEVGTPADRSLGDVHPVGNPHLDLDPVRFAIVGEALAERLAQLDPPRASAYRQRGAEFSEAVKTRMVQWSKRLADAPGAVFYHRDGIYLLERFGLPLLGTIEPIPGVAPTGRHLSDLARDLKGRRGIILYAPYQAAQAPKSLAGMLGWESAMLAQQPPMDADGQGYLDHIGLWVEALARAR